MIHINNMAIGSIIKYTIIHNTLAILNNYWLSTVEAHDHEG